MRSLLVLALVAACGSSSGGDSPGAAPDGGSSPSPDGTSTTPGSTVAPPAGDDDGLLPIDSTWRTTSEWYRPIDAAPAAEHSSEMIAALSEWGQTGRFQIDFSFDVMDATGATAVKFPAQDEGDDVPVPIPAKGYIEGDHAYDQCPDGDDCHILVVDRAAKKLFEVYGAHQSSGAWDGFVALWELDKTYPRGNRGQGCTSADAAGLAITPGLIGYRETKKGAINHALRFIVRNDFIRGKDRDTPNVAYPGSHGTTAASSATGIPYGARLRLKIAENDPRAVSPGAKAIVRALRNYGMILADGGNIPLVAESVRVYADADPAATWDGLLDSHDVDFILPTDFEVIGIPKDHPGGADGWYSTRADYEGQLQKPFGCDNGSVQP